MPRQNKPRTIGRESSLAERIAFEREQRKMSYDGLALRMEKAGCAINASAIYKIEKGDPPRRITVDEFLAFAQVFDLPIEDLLLPADVAKNKTLHAGLSEIFDTMHDTREAMLKYDRQAAALRKLAGDLGYAVDLPADRAADLDLDGVFVTGVRPL